MTIPGRILPESESEHFSWGSCLDLLQEINNRIRSESGRVWNKLYDWAYDATLGLAKQYQQKVLELAKITATSVYLQGLRLARRHALLLVGAVFAVVLLAVTAVVVPVAMVMVTPWTPVAKAWCIGGLGFLYALIVLSCLNSIFSEEKWMKASGFQEMLDSIPTEK